MSLRALVVPGWLEIAFNELGIEEVPGPVHNPRIQEYLAVVDLPEASDETAWCSAFVNWVMKQAGFTYTMSGAARSWLTYGKEVEVPRFGDIVILWRDDPSSWKGHVGFYVGADRKQERIFILGGNQGNMVSIRAYPAHRLLSYRRPSVGLVVADSN